MIFGSSVEMVHACGTSRSVSFRLSRLATPDRMQSALPGQMEWSPVLCTVKNRAGDFAKVFPRHADQLLQIRRVMRGKTRIAIVKTPGSVAGDARFPAAS